MVTAILVVFITIEVRKENTVVTGVVLVDSPSLAKQRPIPNVRIEGPGSVSLVTDSAGLFRFRVPETSLLTQLIPDRMRPAAMPITLEHPDYAPLQASLAPDGQLYVLRMKPIADGAANQGTQIPVSDVRVRYTESVGNSADSGSALRQFDVVNKGNVPCNGHPPCSPDGKWKAGIGGATLDAGEGNVFREARVTCIAGPCPFSRIDKDDFSNTARVISVTVRDWSDTVSYVLEAEVTRTSQSDQIRLSYPIVFGRGLNFSLPPSGEGPSIEASVGGQEIVFPLGPDLYIPWAECSMQIAKDQTKDYRCDLKPGYRFQ